MFDALGLGAGLFIEEPLVGKAGLFEVAATLAGPGAGGGGGFGGIPLEPVLGDRGVGFAMDGTGGGLDSVTASAYVIVMLTILV